MNNAIEPVDDTANDALDAARYRWLRANTKELVLKGNKPGESFIYGSDYDSTDLLDKSIDSAMANLVEGPQMTATEVMQRIKYA